MWLLLCATEKKLIFSSLWEAGAKVSTVHSVVEYNVLTAYSVLFFALVLVVFQYVLSSLQFYLYFDLILTFGK